MDFIMIRYVVSNVQKEDRYKSQMRTQLAPKQTKYRLSVYSRNYSYKKAHYYSSIHVLHSASLHMEI